MGNAGVHPQQAETVGGPARPHPVPGVTSIALAAAETPTRRGRRTETEIAAQAAMAMLAAGLLSTGADKPPRRKAARPGPAVSDAALAPGRRRRQSPVAALRDAWDANQLCGYRPPRPERGRAAAPSLEGQRPGNRERFAAKNPAPGLPVRDPGEGPEAWQDRRRRPPGSPRGLPRHRPLPTSVMAESGPEPTLAFELGALVATPEAIDATHHAGVQVVACVLRHLGGDWGDVDAAQVAANRESLTHGGALRSEYRLGGGTVLAVTTDAGRTLTTAEVGPAIQAD